MLLELNKIPDCGIKIEEFVEIPEKLYASTEVLDIKKLHIAGNVSYDYENNLCFDFEVEGTFILTDALTLDPIEYPFACEIEEKIENLSDTCGEFYEKTKNTLDISEILWENIVLEIPIRATHAKVKDIEAKGSGWELVNEKKKEIDPRMAKLAELFKEGEE